MFHIRRAAKTIFIIAALELIHQVLPASLTKPRKSSHPSRFLRKIGQLGNNLAQDQNKSASQRMAKGKKEVFDKITKRDKLLRFIDTSPSSSPKPGQTPQPTSSIPTITPTNQPTENPTNQPTDNPTNQPTATPSLSSRPSFVPTHSMQPSAKPSTSQSPTNSPSVIPTTQPTFAPSAYPSHEPTQNPTLSPSASPTKEELFTRIIPTFSFGMSFETDPRLYPSFSTKRLETVSGNFLNEVFSETYQDYHISKVTLAFTEVEQRRSLQSGSNVLYYLSYKVYGVVQFRNIIVDDYEVFQILRAEVNSATATEFFLNVQEDDAFPFLRNLIEISINWDAVDNSEKGSRTYSGTPVTPLTIEEPHGLLGTTVIAMILGGCVAIIAGLILYVGYYFWTERRSFKYNDKTSRNRTSGVSETGSGVPTNIILLEDVDSPNRNAWDQIQVDANDVSFATSSSQVSTSEISFPHFNQKGFAQVIQNCESGSMDDSSCYQFTNNVASSAASSIRDMVEEETGKVLKEILDNLKDGQNRSPAPSDDSSFIPIGEVKMSVNDCESTIGSGSIQPFDEHSVVPSLIQKKQEKNAESNFARQQSTGEMSAQTRASVVSSSGHSSSTANSFSLSSMLSKRSEAFLVTGTAARESSFAPSPLAHKSFGASGLVRKVKDSLGLKRHEVYNSSMPRMLDDGNSSISASVDDNLLFRDENAEEFFSESGIFM